MNCSVCDGKKITVGHGTEKIEEELNYKFPKEMIIRIDRDTTSSNKKRKRRSGMPGLVKQNSGGNPDAYKRP